MKLYLVDIEPNLIKSWEKYFSDYPEVTIINDNILTVAFNTIVSPANGYGMMDGGIDDDYTDFFGFTPQNEVRRQIEYRPEGHLPVGAAVLVKTGHSRIPWMISAPTMLVPEPVPPRNAGAAMRAILKIVKRNKQTLTDIFCPGLGTGIGRIDPDDAAREMLVAYNLYREDLIN
mgnify:FL=1